MSVLIVMTTFNGEKFIDFQLDSIFNQSHKDWKLIINDDGSTDKTLEKLGNKVLISRITNSERVGTCEGLLSLIKSEDLREFDYVAFADQDDVWNPTHLETAIDAMESELNSEYGLYIPVHRLLQSEGKTNYEIRVNKALDFKKNSIVENAAIGSGVVITSKVARLLAEAPISKLVFLDWQLYFITSQIGEIITGSRPTVDYRLHLNNQVGFRRSFIELVRYNPFLKRRGFLLAWEAFYEISCFLQAKGFRAPDKITLSFLSKDRRNWKVTILSSTTRKVFFRRKKLDDFVLRLLVLARVL
jgi:glycosyltransferase involved in cell wall biosynthesis